MATSEMTMSKMRLSEYCHSGMRRLLMTMKGAWKMECWCMAPTEMSRASGVIFIIMSPHELMARRVSWSRSFWSGSRATIASSMRCRLAMWRRSSRVPSRGMMESRAEGWGVVADRSMYPMKRLPE